MTAPLARVPEPELMDDPAQALAYAEADFGDAHQRFADEVAARFPELRSGTGALLDLGCGPGDVSVRVARACPGWTVTGVDGAAEMLRLAQARTDAAGLAARVRFERMFLPSVELADRRYDAVVSNSLLHHLDDPATLWRTAATCTRPGAPIAVMDLLRPGTLADVDRMVATYAAGDPEVLQRDFRNSLMAAYRVDEIAAQLAAAGLAHLAVEQVTDRHLLVTGRR
jgi:2-polyprenyl-3-methyl-5-hydroxy-6-metoxy-1,4-benzoquinol methylase